MASGDVLCMSEGAYMTQPTVLVVGGGVMGMATGCALVGQGANVTVLGVVGDDAQGAWLREDFERNGIATGSSFGGGVCSNWRLPRATECASGPSPRQSSST